MMKTDGGPAYPCDCDCGNGKAGCAECGFGKVSGLSKLEVFAMAVMSNLRLSNPIHIDKDLPGDVVKLCFDVAEAMLAESERRKADGG
jgi:hypothetical protein